MMPAHTSRITITRITMFDFLKAYAISWLFGGGFILALIIYFVFFR